MANRIQPHPNPPYWKSDGTINALGQIKVYEAGTSTPLAVFKDASGTSYGSTIDLDSAGLPDEGPIYWDSFDLYKVEVYTRVDSTPTYALDYTVDNFGNGSGKSITGDTSWTVDGVGATSTTFALLSDALDEARNHTIGFGSTLTINIDAGTFTESSLDWSHETGERIKVVGAGSGSTTIKKAADVSMKMVALDGGAIQEISALTFDYTTAHPGAALADHYVIHLENGAYIKTLDDVNITAVPRSGATATTGIMLEVGSYIYNANNMDITDCNRGIMVFTNSVFLGSAINITLSTAAGTYGMLATLNSSISITTVTVSGTASYDYTTGVEATYMSVIMLSAPTIDYVVTGVKAQYTGVINTLNSTVSNYTDNFDPDTGNIKDQTTANDMDTSIIYDTSVGWPT